MEDVSIRIDEIYVPAARRGAVDPATVETLAESILEVGQQTPIRVRRDRGRFVLVSGLHRLEACKSLGEETISSYVIEPGTG